MAAEEEPSETAGETAPADAAHQRRKPERDHGEGEPDPAGLVRLLPGKPPHGPERPGRMDEATPAGVAAQTGETARLRAERSRHPTGPNRWFAARGLFSLEHGSCVYG